MKLYTLRSMLGLNGLINQLLLGLGGLDKPSQLFLFNRARRVLITMVVIYLPFVILPIFLHWSASRFAAARSVDLGASAWDTFRRMVLPLSFRHRRRRVVCFRAGARRFHHAADGGRHYRLHHWPRDLVANRPR